MKKETTTPKEDKMLYVIQVYEAQDNESIECICDVSEEKINEECRTYSFESEENRKGLMDDIDKLENLHYRTTEIPQSELEKHFYTK